MNSSIPQRQHDLWPGECYLHWPKPDQLQINVNVFGIKKIAESVYILSVEEIKSWFYYFYVELHHRNKLFLCCLLDSETSLAPLPQTSSTGMQTCAVVLLPHCVHSAPSKMAAPTPPMFTVPEQPMKRDATLQGTTLKKECMFEVLEHKYSLPGFCDVRICDCASLP